MTSTKKLVELCREESERYRRFSSNDRGHCFELFRRAIVERDQEAWSSIYELYRFLVMKWVSGSDDRVEDRVNETFEKFRKSTAAETFVNNFFSIGKVMRFLQMIAISVRND